MIERLRWVRKCCCCWRFHTFCRYQGRSYCVKHGRLLIWQLEADRFPGRLWTEQEVKQILGEQ